MTNECEHQSSLKGNFKTHFQSTHEGIKYSCEEFDYEATAKSSPKLHIESIHEGIKYPCGHCNLATMYNKILIEKNISGLNMKKLQ